LFGFVANEKIFLKKLPDSIQMEIFGGSHIRFSVQKSTHPLFHLISLKLFVQLVLNISTSKNFFSFVLKGLILQVLCKKNDTKKGQNMRACA
jgi:hypothetical protein